MGSCPENLLYTSGHLWVGREADGYMLGLTDRGVEQLGDIVFVSLPPIGTHLRAGEVVATLETLRGQHDILSPFTGRILDVNDVLMDSPAWINEDAYASWMIRVAAENVPEGLLTAQQYLQKLDEED